MMTTLRSDRRTRRNATFTLECLDDRIVLSAGAAGVAAETHVAAAVSSAHARAHEKALLAHERHELKVAKIEARHAGAVADIAGVTHFPIGPVSPTPPPIHVSPGQPYPASGATNSAVTPSTATSSSTPTNASMVSAKTASPIVAAVTPTAPTSTSSNSGSSVTLPSNLSAQLQSIYTQYEAYESSGASGTFTPTGIPNTIVISGTNIGINFQSSNSADFNTFMSELQSDGLQVTNSSATYGIIDGMVPISQLPTVAQISPTASVTPMFQPMMK